MQRKGAAGVSRWLLRATTILIGVHPAPPAALATVIHVPGQRPTVQAGIDVATSGDTVLVANGTYTGPGNRDISFGGRNIVVRSQGGAAACTIDAANSGRGFVFSGGEAASARLEGFKITHGVHPSAGGGIYIAGSSLTITDCDITDNRTGDGAPGTSGVPGGDGGAGGGVYVASGSPTFVRCSIESNHTGNGGAGFVSPSGPGGSQGGSGGSGGGLGAGLGSQVKLSSCVVRGNTTGAGGAGGSSVVCVFLQCQTFGENGGSGGDGAGLDTDASVEAVNCLFVDNHTGTGGAAGFGVDPPLPVAGHGGDGAAWHGGLLTSKVEDCTLSANFAAAVGSSGQPAGSGGGIVGTPTVVNSIVWGNNSTQIAPLATVSFSDIQGGYPGSGNIDADPLFVAPEGGDYRLKILSPCVDGGSNAAIPGGTTTDLAGGARIVDGEYNGTSVVDMGAYELVPAVTGVGGTESDGTTALESAIEPRDGGPVRIRYRIGPTGARARVDVYDVAGRHVAVVADGWHDAGVHVRFWDRSDDAGSRLRRGVYLVRLSAGPAQDCRKLVLLWP